MALLIRPASALRHGTNCAWLFVAMLCTPAASAGQSCAAGHTYRGAMQAISALASVLDTLPLRGTLDITVTGARARTRLQLGAPRGTVECRVAALWTSRGDSLALHWLAPGDSLVNTAAYAPPPALEFADRPRVIQYEQSATFGSPDIMRSAILSASRAAGGQPRQSAELLILVDTTGRALIARLVRSSGVRELDEAALRIYGGTQYHPAEDDGRPLRAWLRAELHWPGSTPPSALLPPLPVGTAVSTTLLLTTE